MIRSSSSVSHSLTAAVTMALGLHRSWHWLQKSVRSIIQVVTTGDRKRVIVNEFPRDARLCLCLVQDYEPVVPTPPAPRQERQEGNSVPAPEPPGPEPLEQKQAAVTPLKPSGNAAVIPSEPSVKLTSEESREMKLLEEAAEKTTVTLSVTTQTAELPAAEGFLRRAVGIIFGRG